MNHNRNLIHHTDRGPAPLPVFVYLISLQFSIADRGVGFANFEVPWTQRLTTLQHVEAVQNEFARRGYQDALVLGFSLLRTQSTPAPEGRTR